jgi:hypothetical protein
VKASISKEYQASAEKHISAKKCNLESYAKRIFGLAFDGLSSRAVFEVTVSVAAHATQEEREAIVESPAREKGMVAALLTKRSREALGVPLDAILVVRAAAGRVMAILIGEAIPVADTTGYATMHDVHRRYSQGWHLGCEVRVLPRSWWVCCVHVCLLLTCVLVCSRVCGRRMGATTHNARWRHCATH